MTPQVREKLKSVEARYEELTQLISDAKVQADPPTYRTHSKELADMQDLVDRYREYTRAEHAVADARDLAASGDAEMKQLAAEEIRTLEADLARLEADIQQ